MISSVQKALKILKIVSEERNAPVTNSFICEKTGYNKSTCSHILSTLTAEGYLKRAALRGYVLGPLAYCLSRYGRYDDSLVTLCRPVLHRLHSQTGYAVILSVIDSGNKFIIDYIDPDALIFAENFEIRPDDLYRTAAGRIMLANMHPDEIREVYKRHGLPSERDWPGIASYDALLGAIGKINKKGAAFTESLVGDKLMHSGYAVGIYRHSECIAALGVAVSLSPDERFSFRERENELSALLIKARNEIGRALNRG